MACALCETRRPRRFCPGVRGDICTLCCGSEREVSVACPLDCEYLREAHKHEKPVPNAKGTYVWKYYDDDGEYPIPPSKLKKPISK